MNQLQIVPFLECKGCLYHISKKLYAEKDALEQHLSVRANELFDIEDRIMLYDLTNTYFEGRKQGSKLAQYGRSKEKRSDAKLVVPALVVNPEGFIKYLTMIKEKGYDYLCVSRSSLKNYNIEAGATTVTVIKQEDKVYERIGRVKQKYLSIQRYFDIGIEVNSCKMGQNISLTSSGITI